MPEQTQDQTFLLSELLELYGICQPDEELLEEYEDIADEIKHIDHMLYSLKGEYTADDKIKALYHFNSEWFPDLLPPKELAHYADVLEQTKEYLGFTKERQ